MDDGSDLRCGRVRRELLPQEHVLEEFLRGATVRDRTWITEKRRLFGGMKKVSPCTWKGVSCNADQNIVSITSSKGIPQLEGNLSWGALPSTLTSVGLRSYPNLWGEINLDYLPARMQHFCLSGTSMSGTLSLQNLPPKLETLKLERNRFSGNLDLSTMTAECLKELGLRENKLTGSIILSALPRGLRTLDLSSNDFTGPIDLRALPRNLHQFNLSINKLSGTLVFPADIPSSIFFMNLSHNRFSGYLDLSPLRQHQLVKRRFVSDFRCNLYLTGNGFSDWGPKDEYNGATPPGVSLDPFPWENNLRTKVGA